MERTRALTGLAAAVTTLATAAVDDRRTGGRRPAGVGPVVTGLAGPLQLEVGRGRVLVGQSFSGLLTRVRPGGRTRTLASADGEIAGVAARGRTIA
jgi:hypothetical protein